MQDRFRLKLSEWAKKQGISYKTAWRWWKAGQLPVPVEQMPSGTIVIRDIARTEETVAALYARVSSSDQKNNLEAQLGRLAAYASANAYKVFIKFVILGK